MPVLTVWHENGCSELNFQGCPVLSQVLETAGLVLAHPCGSRGVCGKCAVQLSGDVSAPNDFEIKAGTRLSCQAVLLGDATVWLPKHHSMEQIEIGGSEPLTSTAPMEGRLGAAVDIGTTTIALKLCDLKTSQLLSSSAQLNPQTSIAADVMGRIGAAMDGKLGHLQSQVLDAIEDLLVQACIQAKRSADQVDVLVITGNTTMLYLLTGRNPEPLSHAPFQADCLYGLQTELLHRRAYLPACMNAFVGADITCAVLASGMTEHNETSLLCDIGTNGEIALWKNGVLYVTSTAAGPAFEGAGISCGCGSIRGAIDRVWIENEAIQVHTIGQAPAVGLCGSGLIDAIASYLLLEQIDETGAVDEDSLPLSNGIALFPGDVRAVQLAKAAIAAGIQTLLDSSGTPVSEITTLYIAGGFGSHLDVNSAAAIGLIPVELKDRVQVIGNGALSGALSLLLDRNQIHKSQSLAENSRHVNLGGNPKFNANYMEQMMFPEL